MLKYIGNGQFIPGVPARDLTDAEAKQYGEIGLLRSGLYDRTRISEKQRKEFGLPSFYSKKETSKKSVRTTEEA